MKNKTLHILKNGGVLLFLIPVMLYFLLRGVDKASMISTLCSVKIEWLCGALACMAVFIVCEGANIGRCLRLSGNAVTWRQGIKYACVGFFFSSITPSATGGQPMQIFYMKKDGSTVSDGLVALAAVLMNYQAVTTGFAVLGLIVFGSEIKGIAGWLILGIALNVILFLVLLAVATSVRFHTVVLSLIRWFARVFHIKGTRLTERAEATMEGFRCGACSIFNSKKCLLFVFLMTCMQILAYNSIPYFVYRSFGLVTASWWQMFCLQSVLYVSVSALPLPGTVGASEGGSWLLFVPLYTVGLIRPAILLTRFVNFYAPLAFTGAVLAVQAILQRIRSRVAWEASTPPSKY